MADCPYTKIAVMQLFYELKQKYSIIPDEVVSEYIRQAKYDREECEKRLAEACSRFQLHSYPIDLVKKMTEGKGRPKTLPLPNVETNSINASSQTKRPMTSICVEEQRSDRDQRATEPKHSPSDVGRKSIAAEVTPSVQTNRLVADRTDDDVHNARVDNFDGGYERRSCPLADVVAQSSHSAPTTPSSELRVDNDETTAKTTTLPIRKHRSTLNVDRTVESPCSNTTTKQPFTKVTLTLRPPSTQPQPSINISTKGPNLLYTTSSYNPESGYRNQMRISINEEGNTTLSASRLKTSNNDIPATRKINEKTADETFPSLLPAFDNALSSALELRLREQDERKNRLKMEYDKDNAKLKQMQEEIMAMEKELERRRKIPFISEKVVNLRIEVAALQHDCDRMYQELIMKDRQKNFPFPVAVPDNDNDNWTCRMCTFKNHPLLMKCEQCDMAKVDLSNVLSSMLRPPTAPAHLPAAHV